MRVARPVLLAPLAPLALLAACGAADPDEATARPRDAAAEAGEVGLDAAAPDAEADAVDTPEDAPATFPPGLGVKSAVDRSEPCDPKEIGSFRPAPADGTVAQACLPNYYVWAPVVCGGPRPKCTCDASRCLPGEVAKLVSGEFCVCLAACTLQKSGTRCGAGNTRTCIPIDDTTGKQVFVCGGL